MHKFNIPAIYHGDEESGQALYNHKTLYDTNANKNLASPPVHKRISKGTLIRTMRVEFAKLMRTAILKVPVAEYFDRQLFL
jgi:hypothetical protein